MINLTIDGQQISVPAGTTVYKAAKMLGIDLPIFCYHDRMPPFGACRVCLVEVEKMGKPQTSCTLVATDGMVVKTQSAMAADGRKDILEFLLINHPLDCPICDRGGECPLQDQVLAYGPGESRFYDEKRKFKKPLPLGPLLMLDRERCVVCARCTRFSDIVTGDHALEMKERGFKTEVGTPENQPIESKFIGNTIDICPVGALTSNVYRFRARPWDNDSVNTTCNLCPVGCSMTMDSRDNEILRTRPCENPAINDVWLCDKGAFGYEFSYAPDRLRAPLMRKNEEFVEISWEEAFTVIAHVVMLKRDAKKIAAIGGNALTVEENYLFQKLVREGYQSNNIDHRVGTPIFSLAEEGLPPGMTVSFAECAKLSSFILLGIDPTEEFPVLWLRLKDAMNNGAPSFYAGHYLPEIYLHLTKAVAHAPGEELKQIHEWTAKIEDLAKKEGKIGIFVGNQYLASPQRKAILAQLQNIQSRFPNVSLNIMEGKDNSLGARFAGVHPELGSSKGFNTIELLQNIAATGWDILHVVSADPAAVLPTELWNEARQKLGFLVVQDLFLTETAKQANLVLPALCFYEKDGHFLNIGKQLLKMNASKEIPQGPYSDAEIFKRISQKLAIPLEIDPSFMNDLKHEKIKHPTLKVEENAETDSTDALKATFSTTLFDGGVRMLHNPHLSEMIREPKVRMHPDEGLKRNLKHDSQATISCNGAKIEAVIAFDKRIAKGTVLLPLGFKELNVITLAPKLINGAPVHIN